MTAELPLHALTAHIGLRHEKEVNVNLCSARLVEHAVIHRECCLSSSGAVIVETGEHTGRSPNDKFIVDNGTESD
ncbi:MAG TPA: phosphoenolpyruvate carboxykinase (ATP), partial [Anaerolineaceae bacterium]|nr:phosphoenolpyruvate carboxykinase (ATP) [Anaerolineaceae bacterium]